MARSGHLTLTAAAVLVAVALIAPPPDAALAAPTSGTRLVSYQGVAVTVPQDWPIVDVDADPTTCVRLDRTAVYVGSPRGRTARTTSLDAPTA